LNNATTMTEPEHDGTSHEAKAQARAWLIRLRSNQSTRADVEAFRRWCAENPEHERMVRALGHVWGTVNDAAAEVSRLDPEIARRWQQEAAALRNPTRPARVGRRAFIGIAVAGGASWLALSPPLQLWPALGEFTADYRTGTGERRQLALSRRVQIEMNTQTRINLVASQSGRETPQGIELLAGEAEVAVSAPAGGMGMIRPVVVSAGTGRVQANVARFDIRRIGHEVCVTCISGQLAFVHPRQSVTLAASQQLIYDDVRVHPVTGVDPELVTAWRQGLLVFRGTPFGQVVDEINRYRPGKVILRNAALGKNLVQAQLPIDRLDDAIDLLGKSYGAHITRLPGDIVLLG
jgi:transmembrane sensor